ncbi:MAG: SpoIID/LytB domain-containing protein [Oscillospiraceae bacterium]|jgi:stage II sporulation protein D|nr:SpoIID/LytB domain-containing protein [Oscillospiraceae bacterium]
MKRIVLASVALFLAAFAIPLLTAGRADPAPVQEEEFPQPAEPVFGEESEDDNEKALPDEEETVAILHQDEVLTLPLSEYLYGALSAEMPALYPEEALKAQAVAIRTLVEYAGKHPYHKEAILCSDPKCCLAFTPLEEYRASWGEEYEIYAALVRDAVDGTEGEIVTYQGEPIEAVFFSASPGRTRSAAEAWGTDVPYLQSVESPFDDEFPGGAHGHGVGMSQFGARQLALDGFDHREILRWYYTGVEVVGGAVPVAPPALVSIQ